MILWEVHVSVHPFHYKGEYYKVELPDDFVINNDVSKYNLLTGGFHYTTEEEAKKAALAYEQWFNLKVPGE